MTYFNLIFYGTLAHAYINNTIVVNATISVDSHNFTPYT